MILLQSTTVRFVKITQIKVLLKIKLSSYKLSPRFSLRMKKHRILITALFFEARTKTRTTDLNMQ